MTDKEQQERVQVQQELRFVQISLANYRDYADGAAYKTSLQTWGIKVDTVAISDLINKIVSLFSAKAWDAVVRSLDLCFADAFLNQSPVSKEWQDQCREGLFTRPESRF